MPLWVTWILVPLIVQAQSGDEDPSTESQKEDSERLFCTSHISIHPSSPNSLTCSLLDGLRYDEDDEDGKDSIENITVCSPKRKCWQETGNRVTADLIPVNTFTVSVQLRRGGVLSRDVDLRKIVKPKSPQVWNATFNPQNHRAVIHIAIPYHEDYLKPACLLFQFDVWSTAPTLPQNVSGMMSLVIEGEHLTLNTRYQARVRALPSDPFEGTWSDWSEAVPFHTRTKHHEKRRKEDLLRRKEYLLILSFVISVPLAVLIVCLIFVRKRVFQSIHTYMWPNVPASLVPVYKQVKLGFAMSLEPEEFSHMNIRPMEKTEERPSGKAPSADQTARREDDGDLCLEQDRPSTPGPCERSTSDTSLFTGDSVSSLLSFSSEDGPYSRPRSGSPPPSVAVHPAKGGPRHPEFSEDGQADPGPTQPSIDAVYVTMSSFYHSNDQRNP